MESCRIGSCRFLLGFLYFRNIHSLISKNRDLYHSWSWWVYIFLSEHFCAWSPLLAGPPSLSSQRSAWISIFEPLTSQGNMIQGANLKCVANTPGYPGTGPSFQVIPPRQNWEHPHFADEIPASPRDVFSPPNPSPQHFSCIRILLWSTKYYRGYKTILIAIPRQSRLTPAYHTVQRMLCYKQRCVASTFASCEKHMAV